MADSNENANGEEASRKRINSEQIDDNLNSEEFEDEEEIEIIGPIKKKRRQFVIESSEDEEENGKGDENINEGVEDEEDVISAKSDISNFTLADEEDGEEKENVDDKEEDEKEDESEGNEGNEENNEEENEESDEDVDELDGTVEGANAKYEALPLREMPTNEQLEHWAKHAIWEWKDVTMRVVKVREINAAYDWGSHERTYFTKVLLSNDETTKVELQAWNEGQAQTLLDSLEEFQTYTFRGIQIRKISPSNAKYNQGNLPITFGYHKFSSFEPCRT